MSTIRERRVGITRAVVLRLFDEHPEVEITQVVDALAGLAYDDGYHDGKTCTAQELAAHLSGLARELMAVRTSDPVQAGALALSCQLMSAQWYAAAREMAAKPAKTHGPLVEVLADFFDRAEAEAYS